MSSLPQLDLDGFADWARKNRQPYQQHYLAMYSSVFGAVVTDPALMLVPVDDHMVHRGDAVFETAKCVAGNIYNLRAHLDRLCSSAKGLHIAMPATMQEMTNVIVETTRAAGQPDALIRILLSRGPGSLGVSPYECPKPAFYVVVSGYKKPFMEAHPEGARVRASALPVKAAPFARIKSVNYLFNVLMKKEAVDAGVDFVVSFDENGHLAEGPTENAGIVTRDGALLVPKLERILAGTTMIRVLDLARALPPGGLIRRVAHEDIPRAAVDAAAEILIFGTTPDVTAVIEFDGRSVGSGKPGPVFHELSRLLREDILGNRSLHTPMA